MLSLDRRQCLSGLALGGSIAASCATSNAIAKPTPSSLGLLPGRNDDWLQQQLLQRPLFNRENAARVLARHNLDALLVSDPTNVYHLTGLVPASVIMAPIQSPYFALLCRDERQPIRVIARDFVYYYQLSDVRPGSWLETRIVTGPGETDNDPPRLPTMLRAPEGAELTPDEINRRTQIEQMTDGRARSMEAGVIEMLGDAGVIDGLIATDSTLSSQLADRSEVNLRLVGADIALGEIRRVKSSLEIELMRYAAETNAQAAVAAATSLRAGAMHSDLRDAYFVNAVEGGGQGKFMAVDRATSPRFERKLEEGHAFLIDAVASFSGYHGDFGRTIVLGEPSRRMSTAIIAIETAWHAIQDRMQVGATYADLMETGNDVIRRSAMDIQVRFNVHSVGLWHTDDPVGQPPGGRYATRLEPGMILSVDCPLFDEGIGGSAHYEDLTLITEDGPVPLNSSLPSALIV